MAARKKPAADAAAPVAKKRPRKASPPADTPPKKRAARSSGATAMTGGGGYDLVIVESPAKAKTINKYLGGGFRVLASYGHVRDLPKRRKKGEAVAGIDIDKGWVPTYVVEDRAEEKDGRASRRRSPKDILAELRKEASRAERVFLATDPDREGEAIAWHIEDELKLDDARTFRITFNEITKSAVQTALAQAGKIDMDRVRAQEARRILDRVVGYPLSNLLSRKVTRALSAGRVQSVALRLVVDREREIENFKEAEFWKITALLAPEKSVTLAPTPFAVVLSPKKVEKSADGEEKPEKPKQAPEGTFFAELAEWGGKKFDAATEEATRAVAAALDTAAYTVTKVEQKDRPEKAPPPFTTSTLQQQASLRLRFTAQHTMQAAQRLYEGVDLGSEGSVALITYMRTDSTRVSKEALDAVRGHIGSQYGQAYLPTSPNLFASGKSAQEAHEAIRPTDVNMTPARAATLGLHGDLWKLYKLIYDRFVASQMTPAIFAITNVEVNAQPARSASEGVDAPSLALRAGEANATGLFKAQGKILKFDGYRRVLAPGKQEDATLPPLSEKQKLDRLGLTASQHFTQPPPRYNEASLVKALEKEGIGRPSTYASIIGKITSDKRGYIEVKERRFYATDLGKVVTDLLVQHFPNVMDLKFTSHFEEELDDIETGKCQYAQVLDEFWGPFNEALTKAEAEMPSKRGQETGEACPKCGRPMVVNYSKKTRREFVGCSGFKEGCKYIKPGEGEAERPEPELTEIPCPTCAKPMLKIAGRFGDFLGCSDETCKTRMNFDAEGKPVLASRPTEHVCEKCGKPMVIREGKRGPFLACTGYPKCKNAKDVDASGKPIPERDLGIACEKCGAAMKVRKGPRGPFLGCSAFPRCRSTKQLTDELREQLKDQLPAPTPKKELPPIAIHEVCPDCGGPMKLRESRFKGKGGYFLGCTKYPKCKGTRPAPPDVLEQVQPSPA